MPYLVMAEALTSATTAAALVLAVSLISPISYATNTGLSHPCSLGAPQSIYSIQYLGYMQRATTAVTYE